MWGAGDWPIKGGIQMGGYGSREAVGPKCKQSMYFISEFVVIRDS